MSANDFAKKVRRGDTLIIIPITGDAKTEGQGKVLKFVVKPESDRDVNDADLKKVAKDVESRLTELQHFGEASAYTQSDILGSVKMAAEAFATSDENSDDRQLLILYDLMQHNDVSRFESEQRLRSPDDARAFGEQLVAAGEREVFHGIAIRVALLRSVDLRKVPANRRDNIEIFWSAFLTNSGAKSVAFFTDANTQIELLLGQ